MIPEFYFEEYGKVCWEIFRIGRIPDDITSSLSHTFVDLHVRKAHLEKKMMEMVNALVQ